MGNLDANVKITRPMSEYGKGLSATQAMSKMAEGHSVDAEYEVVKEEPIVEPKLTVVRDEKEEIKSTPYESQGLYWKPDGTFKPLLEKMDEINLEESTKKDTSSAKFEEVKASVEARIKAREDQDKKLNDAIARSEARIKDAEEIERQEQEMIKAYDAAKPRTHFNGIDDRFVQSPNYRYIPKAEKPIAPPPTKETPSPVVTPETRTFAPIHHKEKIALPDMEAMPLPKTLPIINRVNETAPVTEKKETPKPVEEKPVPAVEIPKPIAKPAEVFSKPIETDRIPEKVLSPEEKKTLDGLVEFNLGKLGIIDTSDPTKLGEAKQAAMQQIHIAVPNFFALSVPQQLYAIEKLAQKKSHDLDINAPKISREQDAKNTKGGFVGRWWRGSVRKTARANKVRKQELEKIKQGGLSSYQKELNDAVDFTLNRGKDIEMTEKGLMIKFMDTPIEASDKHKDILKKFNLAATVLAETPYISTTKDLSPLDVVQREKFKKAQKAYDKARAELRDFEGKGLEGEEMKSKLQKFSDTDDDIRMNQSLIYSGKTNFDLKAGDKLGRAVRDYKLASKGLFMGAGWAARQGSQYALSLGHFTSGIGQYAAACGAGMVVGGALGGARGWINKRQEFKEMAEQKRRGEEALDKKGQKAKGVKEVIDVESYTAKIEKLIIQIDGAKGKKKEELLQSLQNRAMVARERDELGLVNFGKTKNEFKTKDEFYSSLKMANATLLENDPASMELSQKVADRLQNLYFKDELKDAEKSSEINKAILKGVVAGATFAVVGFEARDYLYHDGEMSKAAIKEMAEVSKKVLGETEQFVGGVREAHGDLIEKAGMGAQIAVKEMAGASQEVLRGTKEFASGVVGAHGELLSNAEQGFENIGKKAVDVIGGNSAMNDEVTGIKKGIPDFQKLKITSEALPNLNGGMSMEQLVGSRGAIGAIDDLQDNVRRIYGGNVPEGLKAFMSAKPEKIAMEWGFYRPGEDAESATILKGAKFSVAPNGEISFTSHEGQTVKLGGAEKFAGKMFDSAQGSASSGAVVEQGTLPRAGFEEASVDNGTVGEYEKAGFDDSAMNTTPTAVSGMSTPTEGWPATSGASVSPESNALEFNTSEIKGNLIVKEDDFGRVTRVEWAPQSRIEEVRQFMATPDKFLVKDLENSGIKYPTKTLGTPGMLRSYGTYELSTASKADGIKYLEMRAALKSGKFPQGTSGYNYIVGQMRLYAASIEGKSGAIFRPAHEDGILKGLKAPRVESVAPTPVAPSPEVKVEAPKETLTTLNPELKTAYSTEFNSENLRGKIEFYQDDKGKIIGLDYGKTNSPYFKYWRQFGATNWESGKSAVEIAKISANLKEFVGLKTLVKFGGMEPKYTELIERKIGVILKNYGEYINDKQYEEIITRLSTKS